MNETNLLDMLHKVKHEAQLPSTYDYEYNQRTKNLTLKLGLKGLRSNMQDDEAAFESWAIALKYYLQDDVQTITIDWFRNIYPDEDGYYHFNRFLYRLTKFIQTYDWARSAKTIPLIPSLLFCNIGTQEAADISKHGVGSEGWLESKYVNDHSCDYDVINHQFPVGLFKGKVSRKTYFTTGHKSAIDIWAIKDNILTVFELKKADNKPLGIISELMFYTNVMNDIMSHNIMFENNAKTKEAIDNNIRGFGHFHSAYANGTIKKIEAVMLADNLHSLIEPGLIDFINDSPRWKYLNISFLHKKVD